MVVAAVVAGATALLAPGAASAQAPSTSSARADTGPAALDGRRGAAPATAPSGDESARGEIVGHAPRVIDGDSLEVRDDAGRLLKIRVSGIDAPEREQPGGDASRLQLATLAGDGPLRLRIIKRDRYGRSVADVWRGDTNLALAQLQAGQAWHFRRYAAEQPRRQRQAYASAEIAAKAARLGLWADPAPQAPWDWRRARWEARQSSEVETITGGRRAP